MGRCIRIRRAHAAEENAVEAGGADERWWVHCWCGALNGEYPTEAAADSAVHSHPLSDRRCDVVLKSPEPPGLRSMPLFLLGDESCTGAAVDQDLDGQWQVTCHCAALDSLRFPTDEEAETAMDEHLDAEDARARALFDQLAAETFNDRFPRG
ncbi:hypothetical protein ACG83_21860 [Frankia sp. R43]|nr:hypothetical protein ACG83_21860 [Frankia sp. R43]